MRRSRTEQKPLKREAGLVLIDLQDEVLVYDLDRDRAHCLNQTAAMVWQRCDGETTSREIAACLEHELGAAIGDEVIRSALSQLSRRHLLQEPVECGNLLSRREAIRKVGLAAAAALPLITSIVAPMAIEAATCVPAGGTCTSQSQCCPGLHCVGNPNRHCA
jgi:hypothetical protein